MLERASFGHFPANSEISKTAKNYPQNSYSHAVVKVRRSMGYAVPHYFLREFP